MMPLCGTYRYVAVVPEPGRDRTGWTVNLCEPIELTGDDLQDDRLVGHSPMLDISESGITPDRRVSPFTGSVRPLVLRSRLRLTAATRRHARVGSIAFHVDQALTRMLLPRDMLFMARTSTGGLALSIVREGTLLAAVGAVAGLPLGGDVHVRFPRDAVKDGEDAFRKH